MRILILLLIAAPAAAQTDITTPYAARRLGALLEGLDAPVGGTRVGAPIRVIEPAPGQRSSVEASSNREVLVYRNYLEKLSGVKVDPARPATVDAAVAALLNHGTRARAFQSILAHELGHFNQGHTRWNPNTPYSAQASHQSDFLIRRLNGLVFTQDLQDAMRAYRRLPGNAGADAPSISSHVYEYLADQHAITATYLKSGDLRGALAFWNKVGPTGGIAYTHPTGTARILNAVSFVEANPKMFAGALDQPLYMRVARDLPPVVLERAGDAIRVSGREAVAARLAPPEKLVYDRFQRARGEYYRRAGSTLLYAEGVRGQRLEPQVADAFAGRPAARATASLHADLARGAILVGPALAVLSGVTSRLAAGDSLRDSVSRTAAALDPTLLATDAAAGTLGAAAGALVPVPVALSGLRVVGGLMRAMPTLAAAAVAARLASQAVALHREGRLDAKALLGSIDWTKMAAQVVGSGAGMALAGWAVSAGLLPALALGPVALVPLAAAIAGGWLAEKLVDWWRAAPPPSKPEGLSLLGVASYPAGYTRASVDHASP